MNGEYPPLFYRPARKGHRPGTRHRPVTGPDTVTAPATATVTALITRSGEFPRI